jgi:type VI secretion system protein VasD
LKNSDAFLGAPVAAFADAQSERAAFGNDVVDVREVVLSPGQRHEVLETVTLPATHIGVVALFRSPAPGRWHYAFAAKDAEATGITLGVHGCAMSVAAGAAESAAPELLRVAGVRCQ